MLFQAAGCAECEGTGYRGRTVIAELLVLDEEIRKAILDGSDAKAIQHLARAGGMATLHQDVIDKAVRGVTTIEEIARVTQSE